MLDYNPRLSGVLPEERIPVMLEVQPDEFYTLLDSGEGQKLEHYGPYWIIRPEGQALWKRSLPDKLWEKAHAIFTGDLDEEGVGRWYFPQVPLEEIWPMCYGEIKYLGRFTSFRHVGVFPEQASHWNYLAGLIKNAGKPVKVLNLFGYTGLASLISAHGGAQVTHVDSSRKTIKWARENQEFCGLPKTSIRWICDDAVKFVEREVRRGNVYDIILLDPPAYGRGTQGEVWKLFDDLPMMLEMCRKLLSSKPLGVILTAYSIRASFFALHALMRDTFRDFGGRVESGELLIREKSAGRLLSTSLFSRWAQK